MQQIAFLTANWVLILQDFTSGIRDAAQEGVPMNYGICAGIRAVWKSGNWGCGHTCHGNDYTWPWQTCKCGCHAASTSCTGNENFSFELMKNMQYVVEQPDWNILPPECTTPSSSNGDIFCQVDFEIKANDTLAVTWFEPSHSISHQDATGPITVDIYCNMKGIIIHQILRLIIYT